MVVLTMDQNKGDIQYSKKFKREKKNCKKKFFTIRNDFKKKIFFSIFK
jgi:hypothetical protein